MPVKEYIVVPSSRKRPCILHLTSSAQIGGTERMLLRFLERCRRDRMQHHVAAMQPEGPLLDAVSEMGFGTTGLSSQNPFSSAARGGLSALLKTRQFSLIHAYGLRADVLARGIARAAGVSSYVSGIRSPDPWRKFWHVWLDRWTARNGRVSLFISNSEAGRQSRIHREKFQHEKIITVHNGINLPQTEPLSGEEASGLRIKYGMTNQDSPVIAVISNLRPMKGHLDLIAALSLLKDQYPKIRFLFAGRDDSDGAIEKAAKEAGVKSRITFCGFVDDPIPLLKYAEIFCMPSHWEGCPTALLEAMALGKPIIATQVGGIPELVSNNQEALLIPPANPQALAQSIENLIRNPQEARRLGENAQRRAQEKFSIDSMVNQIETAYEKLIRRSAAIYG